MSSVLIVTRADPNYFDLALEMFDSVRSCPSSANYATGVLDVGLTDAQRAIFKARGTICAKADWEFSFPSPPGMSDSRLAMYSRPFIPKYFPGYDLYIYLDADTWVQDPMAIETLIWCAGSVDAVVIPEMHVAYRHLYDHDSHARQIHTDTFIPIFGNDLLQPANLVLLNSGVVAGRREGRLWSAWQQTLAEGMAIRNSMKPENGVHPLAADCVMNSRIEQNALNSAFIKGRFSLSPLPAHFNWICGLCPPVFDVDRGLLVDPAPPFTPIQIVHLTREGTKIRQIKDLQGRTHDKSLRWPAWRRQVQSP